MKTVIATGLSLNLPQGWDLESLVETDGFCREIIFRKMSLVGSLELISVGDRELVGAQRDYVSAYKSDLQDRGCRILESAPIAGSFMATHVDSLGQIFHYVSRSSPIVHLSVSGVNSPSELDEVVNLTLSIEVDSAAAGETSKPFGTVLPIALVDSNWV